MKIFSGNGLVEVAHLSSGLQLGSKTGRTLSQASLDDVFNPRKCSCSNEEDSRGINLQELLVRMLASALRGHRSHRSFDDLQKSLLDAFTGNVTRDGSVLSLTSDLVDLIDVDDAALCLLNISAGFLNQAKQNIFNIFTDITGFSQSCRINNCERHIKQTCQATSQMSLTCTRGAEKQDI